MTSAHRLMACTAFVYYAIAFATSASRGVAASEPVPKTARPAITNATAFALRLVGRFDGHTRWVRSLKFDPKGETLISASDDGNVLLWKVGPTLQSNAPARTLRRYCSPVTTIAVSPDGKLVAIGTWDGGLEICAVKDGGLACKLNGHDEALTSLDFHPSGKYVASGSADDRLIVWDAVSGEEVLSFHQGNEYDVTTVAFDSAGKRVISGDGENQLKIWDAETGDEIETLKGHTETVTCASYSPNGKNIVSGGWDDTLRSWDAETGTPLKVFKGHRSDITALIYLADEIIVSASEDKTARLWDAKSGEELASVQLRHAPYSLAFDPRQRLLAIGSQKTVEVFQLSKR